MESVEKHITKLEEELTRKGYSATWDSLTGEDCGDLKQLMNNPIIKKLIATNNEIDLYGSPKKSVVKDNSSADAFYNYNITVNYRPAYGFRVMAIYVDRINEKSKKDASYTLNNREREINLPHFKTICKALNVLQPHHDSILSAPDAEQSISFSFIDGATNASLRRLKDDAEDLQELLEMKGYSSPFYHNSHRRDKILPLISLAAERALNGNILGLGEGFSLKTESSKPDMDTTLNYEIALSYEKLMRISSLTVYQYHLINGVSRVTAYPKCFF